MNDTKEKLINTGVRILGDSRNQLYVAMRFLDIALSSLNYELDLSMRSIGTDSESIRFNPVYLIDSYRSSTTAVNRAYLHMILHCIFRHMFHGDDRDKEIWDISCDIAVGAVLDSLDYRCVREVVPDERQAVYDKYKSKLGVLTAEGIYEELKLHPLTFFEMEKIRRFFTVDDHVFWDSKKRDEKNENKQQEDDENDSRNQEENRQRQEDEWKSISEKIKTNMETYSRDATDYAGTLYDMMRIDLRKRYDYKSFLKKFTALREEIKLDLDSFDYIYYTFGLREYKNMPLIEHLEYKESKKVEELAIVIDTSESCAGDYVRKFLEETFSIISDNEYFFRKMNVHIIQCDVDARQDDVITSRADMDKYLKEFKVIGFGGTDFRPAFEYVDTLIKEGQFKKLKGLLYFTDGYGIYPQRRPDYQTAFVFFEENYNDRQVPPWAIKLILGKDELRLGE